jgi:hypothetical protein
MPLLDSPKCRCLQSIWILFPFRQDDSSSVVWGFLSGGTYAPQAMSLVYVLAPRVASVRSPSEPHWLCG